MPVLPGDEWESNDTVLKKGERAVGKGERDRGRCQNREIVRQRSYKESDIDTSDFLVFFLAT